ncbi:SCO family protein [Thalassolituus pacificus]|uniref:SCO family protein n=1 Tax=Thalassolituus pacificus TaxID=2975440 RepID=A0A9X3AUA4_9GAMM|nr:SCO family protein [Thalassolituus pacificus]MCT7361143.1 SCO family protein [Thalassolituus pacificus]
MLKGWLILTLLLLSACDNSPTAGNQFSPLPQTRAEAEQLRQLSLKTTAGERHLSDFDNQLLLLFFGFSHCPDICPTTLMNVSKALQQLPAETIRQVQPLFITVDPERDSIDELRPYTRHFHTAIIGVQPDAEQLQQLTKFFGIYYRKVVQEGALEYSMDHSAQLLLSSSYGQMLGVLDPHMPADELAQWIQGAVARLHD